MAEAGVPDQESDTVTGIVMRAGTPPEIIERWHREIVRIVALPEVNAQLRKLGFDPIANSPAEFAARIKSEGAKWDKVAQGREDQDQLMAGGIRKKAVQRDRARLTRSPCWRSPPRRRRSPYPGKPVRIIVPFAAGGPVDVVARLVGQKLSEKLGQQFVIENQVGAGGNTGMGNAARAAADGYTILFVSSSYVVNPSLYAKVPYDPVQGLHPADDGGRHRQHLDRASVGAGEDASRSWSR